MVLLSHLGKGKKLPNPGSICQAEELCERDGKSHVPGAPATRKMTRCCLFSNKKTQESRGDFNKENILRKRRWFDSKLDGEVARNMYSMRICLSFMEGAAASY